jgi:hypothetical protein
MLYFLLHKKHDTPFSPLAIHLKQLWREANMDEKRLEYCHGLSQSKK